MNPALHLPLFNELSPCPPVCPSWPDYDEYVDSGANVYCEFGPNSGMHGKIE